MADLVYSSFVLLSILFKLCNDGHSSAIIFHVNLEPGHLAAIDEETELARGNDWKVCYEAERLIDSGHEKTEVIFSSSTITFWLDLCPKAI